jgi:DNA replication protein DnaC
LLTSPTVDKLYNLNLAGMARALTDQRERPDYGDLPFEDRLGLLVDRELQDRENRRLVRYLKAAKLRAEASVEDVDFRHPRGLDRGKLLDLAEARWVDAHQNVLILGPTGVGKTYLACALAQAAIRRGHTALYLRVPRMLSDLATARADGRLRRSMAAWARVDVLVLDDFALRPLGADQAADLLEVVEDRAQLRSTILTSQLPVNLWHQALGEPTVADAILDRVVHTAHRIELLGESRRRPEDDGDNPADEPSVPAGTESAGGSRKRGATKPSAAR